MSVRKTFTTPKGTELPLLNLKGKEYLQVMHRLVWFRENNPTGVIKTAMIEKGGEGRDEYAVFRAEIYVDGDRGPQLVSTAHKKETKGGFEDYIEKAESGSIGRALALMGYGTQFTADELFEGNRLADSPAPVLGKAAETTQQTESPAQETSMATAATAKKSSFRRRTTETTAATSAVGNDL